MIPAKMLEFMACGRPMILGVDGQAKKVVEEARAGLFVEPEDPHGLAQAITRLYGDAGLRESLGKNGRAYILNHLSREQIPKNYISVIQKVIALPQPYSTS